MAERRGRVERESRETQIFCELRLDAGQEIEVASGLPFLDHMLEQTARYGAFDLPLRGRIGTLESETLEEWWRAFSVHVGATMHVDLVRGRNRHHIAESAHKALGLALREAMAVGAGGVPSSKGLLG